MFVHVPLERATDPRPDSPIRHIATPSAFAQASLYYVQETGCGRIREKCFLERDTLGSYLIVYTVSGTGTLTYRNQSHRLRPGEAAFIDGQHHHRFGSDANKEWELYWVYFNGAGVRTYYEQFAEQEKPLAALLPDSQLGQLFERLQREQLIPDLRAELVASSILVSMMTEVVLAAHQYSSSNPAYPPLIQGVMQVIDRDYRQRLTLDRLADRFEVNKFHLAKLFKRCTGTTPGEYMINRRITRAKELLLDTALPVGDIALEVGIENTSHFINLFKERSGLTPLAYRKKWQRI
ncbi:AraC-like protein [Paenibacillus methanolicus]|uniref:AraC-like protein n=1 Tax=Paenibacillus methanolicus TaxID=582686 RepID=A0A5S5C5U9_9BACL|nr:AraC-like protein [Paenibacillus methanolicus]